MKYDIVISLGSECFTRSPYIKQMYGFQNSSKEKWYPAFPFGSEKSYDFRNIINIIDTQFSNYINENKLYKTNRKYKNNEIIKHKKYKGIEFYHSNPLNSIKNIEQHKRRINRFLTLLKSDLSILFIRIERNMTHFITKNIYDFYKTIQNNYPKLNFKLVYIIITGKKYISFSTHYVDVYIIPNTGINKPKVGYNKITNKNVRNIFSKYDVTYFHNHTYNNFIKDLNEN